MTFLTSHVAWTFLNEVSDEELLSSFLNRGQRFAVDEIRKSLGEESVVIQIADSEDVWRVESFLMDQFPSSDSRFRQEMASLLSRPKIHDEYFIHTYISDIWPLSDHARPVDWFHRYVTLLNFAVRSAPWLSFGWPHGRYSLIGLDGNYGAKVLGGLEHSNVGDIIGERFDPFKLRRFAEDLVVFGKLLSNFNDGINDELWTIWFSLVNSVRATVEAEPLRIQLHEGVGSVLSSYFTLRGVESDTHNRESGALAAESPTDYTRHIGRRSPFWAGLELSIKQSTPPWASTFSQNGQRLVGLVMAALSNDPFASRFVAASKSEVGIPVVECTFGFFDVALGLEAEAASRVFSEVDEFMIGEEFPAGRPFFFNT